MIVCQKRFVFEEPSQSDCEVPAYGQLQNFRRSGVLVNGGLVGNSVSHALPLRQVGLTRDALCSLGGVCCLAVSV